MTLLTSEILYSGYFIEDPVNRLLRVGVISCWLNARAGFQFTLSSRRKKSFRVSIVHGCPLCMSMSYIVIMVGICGRNFSKAVAMKVSSVRASCQFSGFSIYSLIS